MGEGAVVAVGRGAVVAANMGDGAVVSMSSAVARADGTFNHGASSAQPNRATRAITSVMPFVAIPSARRCKAALHSVSMYLTQSPYGASLTLSR